MRSLVLPKSSSAILYWSPERSILPANMAILWNQMLWKFQIIPHAELLVPGYVPFFVKNLGLLLLVWLTKHCLYAVTDVHGRTFGVWTLLTCTLCFLCALNLENRPLYLATFLSFIYALGHFLTEYLIYHTMAAANLSTVGFFAGTKLAFWVLSGPLFWFTFDN